MPQKQVERSGKVAARDAATKVARHHYDRFPRTVCRCRLPPVRHRERLLPRVLFPPASFRLPDPLRRSRTDIGRSPFSPRLMIIRIETPSLRSCHAARPAMLHTAGSANRTDPPLFAAEQCVRFRHSIRLAARECRIARRRIGRPFPASLRP